MQNDSDKKKAAGKKPAASSKKRKSGKKSSLSMIQITHSIRSGGRTTINYSKKLASRFDNYVASDTGDSSKTASKKKSKKPSRFNIHFSYKAFFTILFLFVIMMTLYIANTSISTDKQTVTVVGVSNDFEGFTILHLSDLHGRVYGENQASLLRAIADLKYDIIVITGDMVGASDDPQPFYQLLEGLNTSKPIFFICGDSDPGPFTSQARTDKEGSSLNEMLLEDWILGATKRGAIFLDRPVSVEVGSSTLWLSPASFLNVNANAALENAEYELSLQQNGVVSGINVDYGTLPYTNYRYRQYKSLKEAALYMEETDLHITLSHYPVSDDVLADSVVNAVEVENTYLFAPDLALSGHYCGGIIRLPLIGALYVPDTRLANHGWFPNQNIVQGVRQSSSTVIYTTAGLGVTDYGLFPDFRFFNAPQISLIKLTTNLTEDLLG